VKKATPVDTIPELGRNEAVTPVLSVIIVTYKSRSEIEACLGSIPVSIRDRPVEIIVVENASGDGIGKVVRGCFSSVTYIELGRNQGFSKASNIGYEKADGDFILFLNPDTVSNAEAYRHCLERLQADPTIGVISPKLVMLDGTIDLACRRSIPTIWDGVCRASGLAHRFPGIKLFGGYNLTYLPEGGTYDVGAVNGAFMMCSRRALLRVGAFDEQFFMYAEDLDLCRRMRLAGYRVVYDGSVQITHIKGVSSSTDAKKMGKALFSATLQFYLKHFNPHGSSLVSLKYRVLFGLWEQLAALKTRHLKHGKARPP
jgi:N-acetylglucosaminyl-diphospho-decaprenol L-rhamnosyltransferase